MHQDEDEVTLYRDQMVIPPNGAMTTELDSQEADKVDDALEDDLNIPSARFTDYYRWLLRSTPKDTSTSSVGKGDQVQGQIQFEMNPPSDIEEPDIIIPIASPQSQKELKEESENPDQLESFNEEPAIITPVPYPQQPKKG